MSYNLLSGSVNFEGATKGIIEDMVDTHSNQTVSGQKTITNLSSSTAHVTTRLQVGGVHATDHAVNVNGAISGSGNISGSAFYANGVLLETGGVVTALNNRAESRLVTIGATTTELDGEANLTFNGTVLDFKATSISGSGNISGSAFYGNWAGATILGSQVQLASAKGIQDDSGLALDVAGLAVVTPAGGNTVIIDQGAGAKKCTVTNLMALAPVSDASALGNGGRVLLDGGVGTITTNTNLSFGGTPTTLSVTGEISASSNVNVGGILRVDNHISASYMTLANRISHEGDEDTYISLSNNSISFTLANGQHFNMNGNNDTSTFNNSDFKINSSRPDFRIFNATGHVGVGTDTPTVPLEVSSSTAAQLKLTNTVAKAAEFTVAANGDLTIKATGSAIIDGSLTVNDNTVLGNASGDTLTINGTAVTCNNGLNFNSNTLVLDQTNKRIGINRATPVDALHVSGAFKAEQDGMYAFMSGSQFQISASSTLGGGGKSLFEVQSPTHANLFAVVEGGMVASNIVPAAFNANLYISGAAVLGAPATPIHNDNLHNGSVTFYLDEGNSKLFFRVKDSIGQVKSGSVSLS